MTPRQLLRTLVATSVLFIATQASATPILVVTPLGILTGANNVDVGGTLYDVTFADGSCDSLFNGCSPSAFAFTTQATAQVAAQALLDQVFLDGPAGNFDSTSKTFGCVGNNIACEAATPYATTSSGALTALAVNFTAASGFTDQIVPTTIGEAFDLTTTPTPGLVYAVFSLSPKPIAVPEPGSLPLIGLAMAMFTFVRRRKV
jgi:hypothetical protein